MEQTFTSVGLALIIGAPLFFLAFLLGCWNGRRQARWERQVERSWDASAITVDVPAEEKTVYADDDNEWLAGIKSRTDAFIALHCSELPKITNEGQ